MRRGMLSTLPLDLLRHSLKFLSLSDIQSLDNSILSHDLRPFYLSALQGFEISVLAEVICSAKMIQWLSARQLLIRTLKVSSYSPSTLKALISQNQTSLQSFYFSCSEDSFMVSLNKCANLSTLSIDGSLITDEGIHHLLIDSDQQSLLGQRIECLSLSKCIRLTSYSIMLTANYCPQLLELLLSELEFITDSEISLLVQGCKGLRHIDVSGTSITDVSVREILLAYPTLHTFTLFNCRSVSSLAKAAVLQHVASCQIACDHHDLHVLGTRAIRKALSDGKIPFCISHISFIRISSTN